MTPSLVMESETDLLKNFDSFPARDNGKGSHQAATLISTMSGEGIGRFCVLRTSRIPSIAS